ncbi:MAG: hypothetical protein IPK14_22900 [Blastocatellia bacterium]|nr:hypothetical protein [Blastocatellia bacterium]MBL8195632.1 hypothetical protein [Blastocatellia bacterium]MBN8723069.1 hypothetical protein [Acidobacteriota bacterium]
MSNRDVNYLKMLFQSNTNLVFIGVMVFATLVFNSGFLFLLVAGELGLVMLSQLSITQKYLAKKAELLWHQEQERLELQIIAGLGENYKNDFYRMKQLCGEIERRAAEVQTDKTAVFAMDNLSGKLVAFRSEYVKMLRAHYLLSTRNFKSMKNKVDEEIRRLEKTISNEESAQVRATLAQNLKILQQRSNKLIQLADLVRLLEARLQVIRNSLQLIQDEVYSLTNVRGISEMVDGLLTNLELSDEFRSYYDDVLSEKSFSGLENNSDLVLEPDFNSNNKGYDSPQQRQKNRA